MTRMIPPHFNPDNKSPGEREVFERLRDDPATEGWIALHSLHLAKHPKQIQGEADFVVIVPGQGVLVIEVKAHKRVSRMDNGDWHLGGTKGESPFEQADQAMHAIKDKASSIGGIPFVFAVLFTHCRFEMPNPTEWHTWQSVDTVAFHRRPISQLILGILKSHRTHLAHTASSRVWFDPGSVEPTVATCERLIKLLRPSFDFSEPPKIRRYRRHDEVERFTQEQYQLLDMISENQRCIIKGAAGTGKTFIALEAAQRYAAEGSRVLLCCFNKLLGKWLKEMTSGNPGITAGHFHRYMSGLVPGKHFRESSNNTNFFEEELPELALAQLLDEPDPPFNILIIDEAQDLMLDPYLDVFDSALRGGLGSGQWMFFGDFTNQAIYDSGGNGLEELQKRDPSSAIFTLKKNCRNVPEIAQYVEISANLEPGYAGYLRPETERHTEHEQWKYSEDQQQLLAKHLSRLLAEGYSPDEIVVLSPRHDASAADLLRKDPHWAQRLAPFDRASTSSVSYGTVHAFKGLDAPAVIVTGVEGITTPKDEALFYIAASRARDDLTVLAHESTRHDFRRIVFGD
ncbi:NERD domain-containing protein [Streptomyces scopuliridis]|uniref:nuclease-related domain-containing DEAD/DEAH box helicase n=1 Tax=Streptomyces scopuliridis TaxID=452529 RepID=UPI00368CEB7D